MGGSFNPRLSCGAGWIFSKKKLEEVQAALINYMQPDKVQESESTNLPAIANVEEVEAIEEVNILPVIKDVVGKKILTLEYFKIIWHEGRQTPSYDGKVFTNWEDVQKAFYKLWEVNEKGSDGGYTKVKCEIKLKGSEVMTDRIDITNRIKNGDFNPSDMHILEYLESILTEEESQEEITAAANAGKQVSIHNLFSLVQETTRA